MVRIRVGLSHSGNPYRGWRHKLYDWFDRKPDRGEDFSMQGRTTLEENREIAAMIDERVRQTVSVLREYMIAG